VKTTFSTLFILLVLLASMSHAHADNDVEIKGVVSVESHIDIADVPLDNEGDVLLTDDSLFTATSWSSLHTTETQYSVAAKPLTAYSIRAPPASSFISL
jgi:hypothetical protein